MLTTRQAAKRLGIAAKTLSRYIIAGKVPAPEVIQFGKFRVHSWTDAEIEHVRKLLPKIKNGRKTRYQKEKSATGNQQLAKTKRRPKTRKPRAKSRKH